VYAFFDRMPRVTTVVSAVRQVVDILNRPALLVVARTEQWRMPKAACFLRAILKQLALEQEDGRRLTEIYNNCGFIQKVVAVFYKILGNNPQLGKRNRSNFARS
jgi:hypothetical protein